MRRCQRAAVLRASPSQEWFRLLEADELPIIWLILMSAPGRPQHKWPGSCRAEGPLYSVIAAPPSPPVASAISSLSIKSMNCCTSSPSYVLNSLPMPTMETCQTCVPKAGNEHRASGHLQGHRLVLRLPVTFRLRPATTFYGFRMVFRV